jgi:hypothetical protein
MELNSPRKLVLAVAVLFALGLLACGASRITSENFVKIQTGMTQAEVQAILGKPTESSGFDVAGFSGATSTWRGGGVTITVQFVNGKVVAKELLKPGKK